MKAFGSSFAMLSALCLLAVGSSPALADERHGLYFNADLGGSLVNKLSLNEFPDAPPGGRVELHPGVRFGLASGYRVNEWFSAGGEFGYNWNLFKDADGYLSQTPFMGNVEFRLPNKSSIVPFIGGGPGMSFNVIWLDDDSLGNGSRVDGSAGDAVFAWQVYGGFRFKINDSMSAGIVYKYLDTQASEWDVDNTSQDIRFGKVHVHSISATFSMSF
jgi:opacity protein-like surface antigen